MTTEATEAATTQTEATPAPAATPSLLGDAVKTETPATSTETTPAAETKPAETPAKPAEGAPEKYEFKAPEGQQYDSGILSAFEVAAKDSNLSQEAAQKLLDTMSPKIAERQVEQVMALRRDWAEASKTDKEFGGANLEVNLATAKKAYDTFASPELKGLLDSTGLGNHPEVIRMLFKVGKSLSEDSFVAGAAATRQANRLDILYDKTPKE
jgi:hypothetical protein